MLIKSFFWILTVFFLGGACSQQEDSKRFSHVEDQAQKLKDIFEKQESFSERINLNQSEQDLAEELGFSEEDLGFALYDLQNGEMIADSNPDQLFIPASVTKGFSALFALEHLNPLSTFPVKVFSQKKVVRGVLKGDLILVPQNHPSFSLGDLEQLIIHIRNLGITEVKGKFLFASSYFKRSPYLSDHFDRDHSYNASVGAWAFQKNRLPVNVYSTAEQKERGVYTSVDRSLLAFPVKFRLRTDLDPLLPLTVFASRLREEVLFGNKKKRKASKELWFLNHPRMESALIAASQGSRRDDNPVRVDRIPVKDSGLYLAYRVYDALKEEIKGLKKPRRYELKSSKNLVELSSFQGKELWQATQDILDSSDNPGAELLALHAARKIKNSKKSRKKKLSMKKASHYLERWVKENHTTQDWEGFHVNRASGLSVNNRMTPLQALDFFKSYSDYSVEGHRFRDEIMPQVNSLVGAEEDVEINAKTGALSYVRTLSGFLRTDEKDFVFALFINDLEKRAVLNAGKEHPDYEEIALLASEWSSRSRELRRRILLKWITE